MTGSHPHSHAPETSGSVIRWAGIYDLFVNHIFGRRSRTMRREALQQAGLTPGARILDFGCGAGDLAFEAERLTKPSPIIVGIDPSPEMVRVAKGKANRTHSRATFQVEAVEQLSFPDGDFDYVISSFVLHHLPADLQVRAFKELKRILKPGGVFFAIDMTSEDSFGHRLHRHLQGSMAAEANGLQESSERLRQAGFQKVQVIDVSKGVGVLRGQKNVNHSVMWK